jgi:uncharacterized RDD family membrane protein YckC
MENQNILDQEQITSVDSYINASKTKRFFNYLIDLIIIYIFVFGSAFLLAITNPKVASENAALLGYTLAFIGILGYYSLFEGLTSQTIGKMITGTIVITEDGNKISFKNALIRSLCRLIPFEGLSFFGERGWHDTITETRVVNK